jgi:hypothetical protein
VDVDVLDGDALLAFAPIAHREFMLTGSRFGML